MFTDRTSRILEAVVQGFIDGGEPISSSWLFGQHGFGIKPATIRRELELLSDEGYLEQPHHSAGRVPTDRGYEFFADRLIQSDRGLASNVGKLIRFLEKKAFPEFLSEFSQNLSLAGAAMSEGDTYKGGIESLVENFNWETPEEIKSVVRDFAALEERASKLADDFFLGDEPRVFVGKKSPVTKSECLSVVFGGYANGREKVSLLAIGPKRMNYKKAIGVFKNINGRRKG